MYARENNATKRGTESRAPDARAPSETFATPAGRPLLLRGAVTRYPRCRANSAPAMQRNRPPLLQVPGSRQTPSAQARAQHPIAHKRFYREWSPSRLPASTAHADRISQTAQARGPSPEVRNRTAAQSPTGGAFPGLILFHLSAPRETFWNTLLLLAGQSGGSPPTKPLIVFRHDMNSIHTSPSRWAAYSFVHSQVSPVATPFGW